ncbi:MAG: ATP-dependent helicase HrpB [Gammaproteobacteria bacterium]|nr:ATP-dependent helicase HrpB [Gammaproteobacteria bacterium]
MPELPISEALPTLRAALAAGPAAVLEAPPGAGKSTVVPLALLDEPWVRGRKVLMLEPRRLAARAVAERMAATLGEPVGATVGHRMRLDTRVGPRTRIEVVTEGVLTRMLQTDPALEGVAAVLFDEFHERSLQADTGLALCLDARAALGTDLRVVVMSATLDGAAVAALLTRATGAPVPVVTAAGRMFPVAVRYVGRAGPPLPGGDEPPERLLALTVRRALRECEGDVLAFLPGAGEIRRTLAMLADLQTEAGEVVVTPLYGELSPAEQARALDPDPAAPRRVILATNIAETSLTLPRVRAVVDSGLVRRAVFDPVTGMSRLETRRISRAAAEQRAGRAGRVAEGVCYRLWSEGAQRSLAAQTPPEILEADLAPLALDLAEWGAGDAAALPWLDLPPAPMLESARDLLQRLGALDDARRITAHGRALARLPAHPRLAHLLVEAARRGESPMGARLAALLGERDLLRGRSGRAGEEGDADVSTRLELVFGRGGDAGLDRAALSRLRRSADLFARQAPDAARLTAAPVGASGLLACAYPDRIGRRRDGTAPRYLLANGRGAAFAHADRLARSEFIVALDLDDRDREARILLAASLDRATLEEVAGGRLRRAVEVEWSARDEAVVAREVERLDALVIDEKPLPRVPADAALAAMLEGLRQMGPTALPWTEETRAFCARVEIARRLGLPGTGEWPGLTDDALMAGLEDWLAPWLDGVTRRAHLAKLPLADALRLRLGAESLRRLDGWLPTHLTVPTGSRIRIDYLDDLAPCASMRMQEVFGLATTPRLAEGRLPVTFKLLSPAQRPLQVTADLASFWRNAYAEVRKDMRGRYPRHYWPEDPLQAEPVRGIRRR